MSTLKRAALGGFLAVAVFVGGAILSTACSTQGAASGLKSGSPEATAAAVEANQARERRITLAEAVVRNGKYHLPGIGSFQLKDGNYQEKYGDGATQVKRVGVVAVAFGDIDGDKVEDAAAVLWVSTGGSGTFIYVAPVLSEDGTGQQAGAQLLGDRVQIKSLTIDSGKIRVEVLRQGAADPMVSPSLLSVQEFAVQGQTLARLTPAGSGVAPAPQPARRPAIETPFPATSPSPVPAGQPTSRPSGEASSDLAGTIWVWQRFVDNGDKGSFLLPYPAAYRLELLPGGEMRVQADCNSGTGGYTLENGRLELKPGPTTGAECRPGSRSDQFIEMLGQVATYVLKEDVLYLNLKMDGGDMVFGKLGSVTGRIVGPAGEAAPSGGTAEVRLVDGSGSQIGGSIVKAQLPMQFEAPFRPANIDPSGVYSLEVTIKDAQKIVVFRNSRPYPVLTLGNPVYHLEVEVDRVR